MLFRQQQSAVTCVERSKEDVLFCSWFKKEKVAGVLVFWCSGFQIFKFSMRLILF